jgi:SAM-dependent methyltransferase
MTTTGYSWQYYERLKVDAVSSAQIIVPLVLNFIHPRSVVDVGCGTGDWAAAFKSRGVAAIAGIDGDYVDRASLAIAPNEFIAADLTRPLNVHHRYDLAISLEVAEHLPDVYAEQFVDSLTSLAPVVLFSAAIPNQGGEHHVNEQWPGYWAKLFRDRGYLAYDVLRPVIWSNHRIQWWYAQNSLLYVQQDHAAQLPALQDRDPVLLPPALVHPKCLDHVAWKSRAQEAIRELIQHTSPDALILMVDDALLGDISRIGRRIRCLNEFEGIDHGPPEDSQSACRRLQLQRDKGADYIAFAWPSFWWLEYYVDFAEHLCTVGHEILRSSDWVVFALHDA